LTAGIHNPGKEDNTLRMDGTLYNGHNFALLSLTGTAKDRVLKIQLMNNQGQKVWDKEIKASELK
jgi:hypothetical protein